MRAFLIRLVVVAGLLSIGQQSSAQSSRASDGPSLDRPCSFVTAAEMAGLLGTPVAIATDERFRCKYVVGKGWLETKLMNLELKMTRDIYDYNKAHGKPMPGVGDRYPPRRDIEHRAEDRGEVSVTSDARQCRQLRENRGRRMTVRAVRAS